MMDSFWRSSDDLSVTSPVRYCACRNTFRAALEGKLRERFLANSFRCPTCGFLYSLYIAKSSRVSHVDIRNLD